MRAQGRATMRKLLDAGRAAFEERGFHAVRVDDIVKAAKTSHGTFYLYFANKEDLFKALTLEALRDMEVIAAEFPRVTPDDAGRAALRRWVQRFGETYARHATVIRTLSHADVIGEPFFSDGLQLMFRLSEAIVQGMTEGAPQTEHAELTALACLMMLERVNYLLSVEVKMPAVEMVDRISAIIFSAFHPAG